MEFFTVIFLTMVTLDSAHLGIYSDTDSGPDKVIWD